MLNEAGFQVFIGALCIGLFRTKQEAEDRMKSEAESGTISLELREIKSDQEKKYGNKIIVGDPPWNEHAFRKTLTMNARECLTFRGSFRDFIITHRPATEEEKELFNYSPDATHVWEWNTV